MPLRHQKANERKQGKDNEDSSTPKEELYLPKLFPSG